MTRLREVLEKHVGPGSAPGAVGLVAGAGGAEVEAVGSTGTDGAAPMRPDSIFRIASMTKPVTAAATMVLVDEGRLALTDPVAEWLPELASPVVVRTPESPVDDVVPAARPITVLDLLTFRAGYGFPADVALPAVEMLFRDLDFDPMRPQRSAAADAWLAALSRIPLLHQPGETWLYHTCSDILGVLIARASGTSLPDFFAERLFEPLGMDDTAFEVPESKRERFTDLCRLSRPDTTADGTEVSDASGGVVTADTPGGQWSSVPAFPSGGGGLVSTAADWHAFARMLLAEGEAGGRRVLSPGSVRQMTTDQLTAAQRAASPLFPEGQGWGFGGSVDVDTAKPWNVPGRYGWVGGSGTSAHLVPSTGTVAILLTQLQLTGPTPPAAMRDFWCYAAGR
ncbi:CubicO group peptidase (beta-lactamase class C family) [Streptomyces sp. Amel2xB2]|uniref:serine hydrolase domain-containing protein n=1 Tax=Streptomyces sp. Amel2xB2 TaxID=1305829 RepID=UPI000DB9737F|nr:serine hydrolase domain-containing protein [Streptomyces sp. Amel2xB2]RAJ69833.1 CubicO group peptidase (beta-lactamase class C family) [Streptomyces sp. Amel2xB2]